MFANKIDYGKYMKVWRFKELKMYIPKVMEDEGLKETDDWWKFKTRVNWNEKRKMELYTSFVLVFNESMSAFIPRFDFFIFFFIS